MSYLKKSLFIFFCLVAFPVLSSTEPAAAFKRVHLDDNAPVFILKDLDGNDVNLASYSEGPLTVVVFWAMWSERSAPMLRDVQKIVAEFGDKGVRALSVNVDQSDAAVDLLGKINSFIKENSISFPTAIDSDLQQYNEWGVIATPATAFLAKDLKVVYLIAGHPTSTLSDMKEKAMEVLGIKEQVAEAAKPKRERYKPSKTLMRNFGMANVQFSRRQPAKAARKLKPVLDGDPNFPEAHALNGAINLALHLDGKEGAEATAKEAFNKAVELDETVPLGLAGLAYFALKEDDVQKALEHSRNAIKFTEIEEFPNLPPMTMDAPENEKENSIDSEKSHIEESDEPKTEAEALPPPTEDEEVAKADDSENAEESSDDAAETTGKTPGSNNEALVKSYLSEASSSLDAGNKDKAKELLTTLVDGLIGIPKGPKMSEMGAKMRELKNSMK